MPVSRHALIRYRTIDRCLQNHYRRWTLEDLIEACSEALYEYEGINKGISRRTIQLDLQLMRSDKLGYNAPIVVVDKKYYVYEEKGYSITRIPLSEKDIEHLSEAVEVLKQFKGFAHFSGLADTVSKLEDKIHSTKTQTAPVIDFEKNERLVGLEFLDILYKAIIERTVLELEYQSFKALKPGRMLIHPWMLKEYRNRWFLLGVSGKGKPLLTLALDRIKKIKSQLQVFYYKDVDFDPGTYYQDIIGVTQNTGQPALDIHLWVNKENAPYVLTKPFHASQQLISEDDKGIVIALQVKHNFELERDLLGFGEAIKVLQPAVLQRRLKQRLQQASQLYEE